MVPESQVRLAGPLRILLAAEKVFVREGVQRARMDAIAAEAGMARSHVYYHFKNKDEVFSALVELRTADLLAAKAFLFDELSQAAGSGAPTEPEHLIRAALERVMEPYRDFLRLLLTEAIRSPELPAALTHLVRDILTDTLVRMGVDSADPERAVDLFYLLIAPALLAVVLPADPTGVLRDAADIAPHLLRARDRLLPPDSPASS